MGGRRQQAKHRLPACPARLRCEAGSRGANPINEGNKKVPIFTAFADTANYLYNNLAEDILLVSGGKSCASQSLQKHLLNRYNS